MRTAINGKWGHSSAVPQKLYTPKILALAVELTQYPSLENPDIEGDAHSQICGSKIAFSASLDPDKAIAKVGLGVAACAIGQAAASIFARHAEGKRVSDIAIFLSQLDVWLKGDDTGPAWPDFHVLDNARNYPGRHGAIALPWKAAQMAFNTHNL